jgi:hypothetical protein
VVIFGGFQSYTTGINWRLYGKANFPSGGPNAFYLDVRSPATIYFEFLQAGVGTFRGTGGCFLRAGTAAVSNITIRAERLESNGLLGGGAMFDIQGNVNLDLEVTGYIISTYIIISCQGGTPGIAGMPIEVNVRCPRATIINGGYLAELVAKIGINSNGQNINVTWTGDLINLSTGHQPYVPPPGPSDQQGLITVTNNNSYPLSTITVNGTLDGRTGRCICGTTTGSNRNREGRIIINGNLINNPDADYAIIWAGWNADPDDRFFTIIVNNGYIQGGSGNDPVDFHAGSYGMIKIYNGIYLWLNNCILHNQKNTGIVPEDTCIIVNNPVNINNTRVYMYNCNIVTTNLSAYAIATANTAGSSLGTSWGVTDTYGNTNAGAIAPAVTVPADVWGGFTEVGPGGAPALPPLVVPTYFQI